MFVSQLDQARCPRVDEARGEDVLRLVVLALGEEPTRGLEAGGWQLVEAGGLRCVAVDLALTRVLFHARLSQANTRGDGNASKEQVDRCGPVGAAQLHRLRVIGQVGNRRLKGVGIAEHRVVDVLPAKRHAHQNGAVAVTPADRGWRLLMGNKTQERGRDGVTKRCERCCVRQVASDHLERGVGETRSRRELVDAILDDAGMEVHARSGLPHGDLRREGDMNAIGMGNFAQHPLGEHHLVGSIQRIDGQELDLLLHHLTPVRDEVTDLGMGVLHRATDGNEVREGLRAHFLPLGEGPGFVVAALRLDGEQLFFLREEVVLEFTEGLQLAARLLLECSLSLPQDFLGRRGQGATVNIVEAAQDIEGRDVREGVEERGSHARHDIQVRGGRLDECEQGGTVDALSESQHPIEVSLGLDREVQGLQASVPSDVAEVEHLDAIVLDIADDVGFRKLLRGLSEGLHERVGVQRHCVSRQHETLLFEYD